MCRWLRRIGEFVPLCQCSTTALEAEKHRALRGQQAWTSRWRTTKATQRFIKQRTKDMMGCAVG